MVGEGSGRMVWEGSGEGSDMMVGEGSGLEESVLGGWCTLR